MIDPFPLLCDYVVQQLQAADLSQDVVIARTWKHYLTLKEIKRDIRISVAPWDFDREFMDRGRNVIEDMIVSTVIQSATQWEKVDDMDAMSMLSREVLTVLTGIQPITLGTPPDQVYAQIAVAPMPEPYVLPEDVTELGLFTSRLATRFVVQEV